MIATRRSDADLEHPTWAFNKQDSSTYSLPSLSTSRMSTTGFETPLSSATDWQGQYSFLPPAEPIFAAQAYDHVSSSTDNSSSTGHSSGTSNTSNNSSTHGSSYAHQHQNQHQSHHPSHDSQSRPATSSNADASLVDSLNIKTSLSPPLSLGHRRSLDPLGLRQYHSHAQRTPSQSHTQLSHHRQSTMGTAAGSTALSESHSDHHGGDPYGQKTADSTLASHEDNPLSSILQISELTASHMGSAGPSNGSVGGPEDHPGIKADDDDDLLDDEMGEGAEAEAIVLQPQTAAERTAQRRKMKRFRLTHQQTRFLMSEFAKQPHPDAAHRERLSREIPGLSPRQVQVWFQNRRAKIKRLAADDRERMIKMRAVPDDFDNVQALHSPYGAVHGLGTPMASPVDFNSSTYDHIIRPLMVDVRRPDGDDHLSPTGLSPAFGSIGFNPANTNMNSSDILSPISPTSTNDHHHRYGTYSGQSHHLSAAATTSTGASSLMAPLNMGVGMGSMGSRTSNLYATTRHNSLDGAGLSLSGGTGSGSSSSHHGPHSPHHIHPRHPIRPLQPLQLREAMSRSRSENLQSPLRSSMSWKGNSLDYSDYHNGGSSSPQLNSGNRSQQTSQSQQQSQQYSTDSLGSSTTPTTMSSYDSSPFSGSTAQSATSMDYKLAFPSLNSLQQQPLYPPPLSSFQSRVSSRLRAASAMLPLGLDIRTKISPATHTRITTSSAAETRNFATFLPSAPLTDLLNFSLSSGTPECLLSTAETPRSISASEKGKSASISAMDLSDFSHVFQNNMTSAGDVSPTTTLSGISSITSIAAALNGGIGGSVRTPLRDSFDGFDSMVDDTTDFDGAKIDDSVNSLKHKPSLPSVDSS